MASFLNASPLRWWLIWLGGGLLVALIFFGVTVSKWNGSTPANYWIEKAAPPAEQNVKESSKLVEKKTETLAQSKFLHERGEPSVYQNPRVATGVFAFGWAALIYAVFVGVTLLCRDTSKKERTLHLVLWAIGPPLFFFIEWFYLFPNYGVRCKEATEALRSGQEVASALWAGIGALFAALYFEKSDVLKR